MPLPKTFNSTIEDIYALPDGQRAELINGKIYDMAPPGRIHQELVYQVGRLIGDYIDSHEGACKVYPAPFAVKLNADDKTYVEPDISVICDIAKLTEQGCSGAPDFIVEIVSPGSRTMDYSTKNALYSSAGFREYWIIDPAKERTTIYHYEQDAAPIVIPFAQDIEAGIYKGLKINIASLLK